jgi:hypothetical protein
LSTATKWREAAGVSGRRREAQPGSVALMESETGNILGRGKMRIVDEGGGGRSGF